MRGQIREIRVKDILLYFALPLFIILVSAGTVVIGKLLLPDFSLLIFLIPCLVISLLVLKPFVIGIILLYKALAPVSVRERCRFEPTCSTYMIIAIRKYGLVRGVYKGIRRIMRCKPPNGGVDMP